MENREDKQRSLQINIREVVCYSRSSWWPKYLCCDRLYSL